MSEKNKNISVSRRNFLKGSTIAGASAGAALSSGAASAVGIKAPHKPEELKDYTEHWSFCDMCYWRCGLKARSRDGKAFKIDGNPHHPNNYGVVCAKGNAGISQVFDPDRLKYPMIRTGERGENKWARISWDEAYERIADGFLKIKEKYGPEALVLIGHGTWEKPYHRLMHALGTPNTTSPVFGLCCGPRGISNMMVAGKNLTGNETYDLENCKYFLMVGRNVTESLHNGETLGWVNGKANGAKSVYVDPRFTITASKSEEWLAIRPTTDHAFLLALINVVIEEKLYDEAFIADYAIGLDELKARTAKYTPEWQADITDIPPDTVRRIAREMGEAAPSVLVYSPRRNTRTTNDLGMGVCMSILNSLFGVWDRKGGVYTPQGFSVPEPDLPPFPHALKSLPEGSDFDFSQDQHNDLHDYVERADGAGVPGKWPIANAQYGLTNQMWKAMANQDPYPLKGLLTAGGNGFMQSQNKQLIHDALMQMDFYVAADILPNEMNAYADILIAESAYLERYDDLQTGGAREGYVALREPAMAPLHDTRSSWEVCTALSRRMGVAEFFPHENMEELLEDRLSRIGSSLDEIREKGILFKPADDKVNFPREYGGKSVFPTPSGKIELMPTEMEKYGYLDALDYAPEGAPDPDEFYFTVGRVGYHTHARTQNNEWLMYFMPENVLWLHPDAAKDRNIGENDRVTVKDRLGREETLPVKITPRIRKDTVFMVHGFGHWDKRLSVAKGKGGADANLASDAQDKRIGTASMGLSLVKVTKA
jgi:thiosulfate reductase/polysulfide reductase chain A